ncbi:MAG: hypothetical protein WDW36_004518 [Sanguina aurantia]
MLSLVVSLIPERSCWVSLPPRICNDLVNSPEIAYPVVLKLSLLDARGLASHKPVFVAWSGAATAGRDSSSGIGMAQSLAAALELYQGARVQVVPVFGVPAATEVEVSPRGPDDWEVVEACAEFVTDNLLTQVGIACKGQSFPMWAMGGAVAVCQTLACSPHDLVRLVNGTEVMVAPRLRMPSLAAHGLNAGSTATPAHLSATGAAAAAAAGAAAGVAAAAIATATAAATAAAAAVAAATTAAAAAAAAAAASQIAECSQAERSQPPEQAAAAAITKSTGVSSASKPLSRIRVSLRAQPMGAQYLLPMETAIMTGLRLQQLQQQAIEDGGSLLDGSSVAPLPTAEHLVSASSSLSAVIAAAPAAAMTNGNKTSSSSSRSEVPAVQPSPSLAVAAVASTWLSTAAAVSPKTAASLRLVPGCWVDIRGSQSVQPSSRNQDPSAGSSSDGVATVLLLVDACCPEGHVMLAPPLMTALGVLSHSQLWLETRIQNGLGLGAGQLDFGIQLEPLRDTRQAPNTASLIPPPALIGRDPSKSHVAGKANGRSVRFHPSTAPGAAAVGGGSNGVMGGFIASAMARMATGVYASIADFMAHGGGSSSSASLSTGSQNGGGDMGGGSSSSSSSATSNSGSGRHGVVGSVGGGSRGAGSGGARDGADAVDGMSPTGDASQAPAPLAAAAAGASRSQAQSRPGQQGPAAQHPQFSEEVLLAWMNVQMWGLSCRASSGGWSDGWVQQAAVSESSQHSTPGSGSAHRAHPTAALPLFSGMIMHMQAKDAPSPAAQPSPMPSLHSSRRSSSGTSSSSGGGTSGSSSSGSSGGGEEGPPSGVVLLLQFALGSTLPQAMPGSNPPTVLPLRDAWLQQLKPHHLRVKYGAPLHTSHMLYRTHAHRKYVRHIHPHTPVQAPVTTAATESQAGDSQGQSDLGSSGDGDSALVGCTALGSCGRADQSAGGGRDPRLAVANGAADVTGDCKDNFGSAGADGVGIDANGGGGGGGGGGGMQLSGKLGGWLWEHLDRCLQHVGPAVDPITSGSASRAGLPPGGGLLVTGPAGSGRSTILQELCTVLASSPACPVHTLIIDCSRLVGVGSSASGGGSSGITGILTHALLEAQACAPSLLVFDDLDLLLPAAKEGVGQDGGGAGDEVVQLAGWLEEAMREVRLTGLPVAFAAAARDPGSLHPAVRQAGSFDHQVRLPTPGSEGRCAMLLGSFQRRGVRFSPAQLKALAGQAEGYEAADLEVLLERAVHAAMARGLKETRDRASVTTSHNQGRSAVTDGGAAAAAAAAVGVGGVIEVNDEDLQAAFQGFVPPAFWGMQRSTALATQASGWADVGGLPEVKAAFHEALILPVKYASLVAAAPLRLRTGLLLYGPPGCGKTHCVAAAVAEVARVARTRFISVKGPELLNKYIGASEAAVRELFQRASAAAPAVLFFDEFDAIAPPRGHDSTGVTDRVVNQLLTELDGVEGLKGVTVVAATSRPDLIDAALLRPGRLDRLVYCGLPEEGERQAVLRALSRNLAMAPGVDLAVLASMTDGFTGADLGALLSEAQLASVHQRLEERQQQQETASAIQQPAATTTSSSSTSSSSSSSNDPRTANGCTHPATSAPTPPTTLQTSRAPQHTTPPDHQAAASEEHPTAKPTPAHAQPLVTEAAESVPVGEGREKRGEEGGMPTISMSHLLQVVAVARPSLPPAELRRLQLLYARFREAREPAQEQGAGGDQKKMTLA